jgi:hypothetical protein
LLCLVALTLFALPAAAERPIDPSIEISALAGGAFGGSIKLEDGDKIDLGASWAVNAILGIRLRSDEGKLLVVSYHMTRSPATFTIDGQSSTSDVDVGHLQFGGEIDGRMAPYFKPFFGLTVGAAHFSPTWGADTEWFFSAGFYGGVKVPVNKHFGLRLQGRMMGTIISGNSSLFFGPGGGAVVTVDSVSGPIQGDLQAGLYYAF